MLTKQLQELLRNPILELLLEDIDTRIYRYVAVTDKKTCPVCSQFDGDLMSAALAEATFDHVYKYNDDFWLPRTHLDLWNKDTCRCALIREGASAESILQAILRQQLEGFSPFQLRMHALALSSIREVRKIVLLKKCLKKY